MTRALAPRTPTVLTSIRDRLSGGDGDGDGDGPDIGDLRAALEAVPGGTLHASLTGIRDDPDALDRVVAGSYWHANGFAKLVLDVADGFRIRLHVWPAGTGRRGESDPHSHRWDFASTVVAGDGLEIVEWEPRPDGDAAEFTRWDYDGTYLVPRGTERLGVRRAATVRRGTVYTTDTRVVHTVRPAGDDLVATLLVQGPHRSSSTVVYRPAGEAQVTGDAVEGVITRDEVATLLTRVADALGDGPALRDLGERRILSELLAPRYRDDETYGDDCADLGGDLVATTDSCSDALVCSLGPDDPYATGWLLAVMNLSDLAAAGATPDGLVVNYTLPADTPVRWFERLVRGVDDCAAAHGTRVRGGDLREGPVRLLTATAIGRRTGRLGRRGARAGDRLLLVGSPGHLWAWALAHRMGLPLSDAERAELRDRARRPRAELAAGRLLAGSGLAHAAMDVSDGLFAAVRTLAGVNGLGAVLRPEIDLDPVPAGVARRAGIGSLALGQMWGDWNLLVAVSPDAVRRVRDTGIDAREIGTLVDGGVDGGVIRVDGDPEPWAGIDQERFTACSWTGDGVDAMIARLRTISAPRDRERC